MSKRKPLGQKVRFEVFKRDNFTCQYCGAKAPDVLLECDHINPVSKGGTNDIINLVTACKGCNGGKGARKLDDASEIEKQRQQLEDLNERRKQLEAMLEWRDGLIDVREKSIDAIAEHVNRFIHPYAVNRSFKADLKRHVKKFSADVLMDAIDRSADAYLEYGADDEVTSESADRFLSMIPRIATNVQRYGDVPEFDQALYVVGILKRRFGRVNQREALDGIAEFIRAVRDIRPNGNVSPIYDSIKKTAAEEDDFESFLTGVRAAVLAAKEYFDNGED